MNNAQNQRQMVYACPTCQVLEEVRPGHVAKLASKDRIPGVIGWARVGKGEHGHDQDVYRACRGHAVADRSKLLAKGRDTSGLSVAPLKLCAYCLIAKSDAHVAGVHSLTCERGPMKVHLAKLAVSDAIEAKLALKKVASAKAKKAKK